MKIKAKIAFTRCPINKWDREHEITSDQLSILRRLLEAIESDRITREQNVGITNLWKDIFGLKKDVSSCGTCVAQTIKDLKEILQGYED
jgi:predicted KAP-like P-loop ATPase